MGKKRRLAQLLTLSLTVGCFAFHSMGAAAPLDLSLEDSIVMALQYNSDIKIAATDKEKARQSINAAEAGKMPTLSLNSGYTDGNSMQSNHESSSLGLSWSLYSGGRIEGEIKQAELGFESAEAGIVKARQQVWLDTTTAYYNALEARNTIQVNQESVDNLQTHLQSVQVKYEVGVVAKVDVLRSEVELANAEQNLLKAQNSYDLAIAKLNDLIGMDLSTELNLKDEFLVSEDKRGLDECVKLAMANRPELKQSELNIEIYREGVKIARSGHKPTLSLGGGSNWDSLLPGDGDSGWSANLKASWNVFDGGQTSAKIKESEASVRKAEEQAKQNRDNIQLEVRQAYLSMREAAKRIDTTRTAVDKGEEDFKIAQARYDLGAGTNLELIDTQLALTQAKTNYVQALFDYSISRAQLDKATGVVIK